MPTPENDPADLRLQHLKSSLREITHELNNPLGVIRMAAYFLEHNEAGPEKRDQYFKIINESLDKAETVLKKLRALRESHGSDGP
jgi:signal transduction histidine kinase